jgi:hypothetical protein
VSIQPDNIDELEDFLRRHRKVILPLCAPPAAAGVYALVRFHEVLFGPGTWGAGGNLVAWAICGILGGLLIRAQARGRALAQIALAKQHQRERQAQHEELREMHQELKEHITRTVNGGLSGS